MAKCRIGHFVEAQILQALEVDYIDESEVLTPADVEHHVDKWEFTVPFVCGATNLGEALRRISEGAAMIRTKGEAGTGDIVNAVTHMRAVFGGIRRLQSLRSEELYSEAKQLQAPYELVRWVAENGRLPVVTFTAGGIATPADAALCMQLGADGVFVGSGIFKSGDSRPRGAKAIVEATTHFDDAEDPGRCLRRPRRAHGRHRRPARSPTASGSKSAAGSRRRAPRPRRASPYIRLPHVHGSAFSRCRARFASTCAMLRRLGADVVEVRLPEQLEGLDGLVDPGRRVDDDDAPVRPLRARRGDPPLRRCRLRDVRRDDPARPRRGSA